MKSGAAKHGRGAARARSAQWTARIVGIAIAIAAVSCASTAPPTETTVTTTETTTTTTTAAPSLASTNWQVVEVRGVAPSDKTRTTLLIDSAGRVTGTTGCNNYTSTVTYAGTDITFAPVVVTRITCADTTRIGDERRFLEDFVVVKTYEVNGTGDLVLKDVNGTTVVRLTRVP
jgi:heat shock protein HslJ